jgi:hypothetical protein
MQRLNFLGIIVLFIILGSFISCNSSVNSSEAVKNLTDSINNTTKASGDILSYLTPNLQGSSVLLFNFHATNRCISCNAIEANAKKTVHIHFSDQEREGRVKVMVFNVDDDENAAIAETFQATGTSLFIVKVLNGNYTITDVTGEGFKYAKNNPDELVKVLKDKIAENLKD